MGLVVGKGVESYSLLSIQNGSKGTTKSIKSGFESLIPKLPNRIRKLPLVSKAISILGQLPAKALDIVFPDTLLNENVRSSFL